MASSSTVTSRLGLEGLHVLVTGAAGEVGRQTVREFLGQGCKVTALDIEPFDFRNLTKKGDQLCNLKGDILDEDSVISSIAQAVKQQGPINILIANDIFAHEGGFIPIWDLPLDTWEQARRASSRGKFLAIKHFLRSANTAQQAMGSELENLAIVVVEYVDYENKFGHVGSQYKLVGDVQGDISILNSKARVTGIELTWIDTRTVEGERGEEIARASMFNNTKPEAVAKTIAFLASHQAAGHISGQYVDPFGTSLGQFKWEKSEDFRTDKNAQPQTGVEIAPAIPLSLRPKRNKIRITISVDLDAVSGWLGTGQHPDNILADYSSGFFAGRVGAPRLLRMLKKLNLADRCTWFIPGHSAESFPEEVKQVVDSGCEIGLHGYAHEGAYQLTPEQEREVLVRCIEIAQGLTGKKPIGYRAPLYQLRESTLDLLEEFGFEYDASLTDHDSQPFYAPSRHPITPPNFSLPASTWMHPIPAPSSTRPDRRPLVCIPSNWYTEDMTPLQFLPHTPNSHGYTDVRVIENMWKDRFTWLRENEDEPVFPVLMHPDTSGMAHVIGMVERFLT